MADRAHLRPSDRGPRAERARRLLSWAALASAALAGGCYHFAFDERTPQANVTSGLPAASGRASAERQPNEVTFVERKGTYLNGFVGTGKVDTSRYCAHPIRTELKVTTADVLLGMSTLLVYTPHTLYVTCPRAPVSATSNPPSGSAGYGSSAGPAAR